MPYIFEDADWQKTDEEGRLFAGFQSRPRVMFTRLSEFMTPPKFAETYSGECAWALSVVAHKDGKFSHIVSGLCPLGGDRDVVFQELERRAYSEAITS